jgi:5-methylthioadenosine/S-adenosylhomocysteine deaminase
MSSSEILIKNAIVLTMDDVVGDFDRADVLIRSGTIGRIAPDIGDVAGAEAIDANGCVVIPGLVDSHRHLWHTVLRNLLVDIPLSGFFRAIGPLCAKFTPDDLYVSTLLGAAECLNAGVTTVLDWCHCAATPAHADQALRAIFKSGARVVFAYGSPLCAAPGAPHPEDIIRVQRDYFAKSGGLVSLAMAARGPEMMSAEQNDAEFALARRLGVPISLHTGAVPSATGASIAAFHERGQGGADINYVHLNYTDGAVLDLIAKSGGTASITPYVETVMGAGPAPTEALLSRGVKTGLGADTALWGASNLFTEMRMCLSAARVMEQRAHIAKQSQFQKVAFRAERALSLATRESAAAIWLDQIVGSLAPGKRADLILIDRRSLGALPVRTVSQARNAIVMGCEAADVRSVMVDGAWVKRDGALLGIDLEDLGDRAERIRQRLAPNPVE